MARKRARYNVIDTERMQRIHAALEQERSDFNAAITRGATPVLSTAFGPYVVTAVTPDHWYVTYPQGTWPDTYNRRSFAGCNDEAWASLLEQASVTRQPY